MLNKIDRYIFGTTFKEFESACNKMMFIKNERFLVYPKYQMEFNNIENSFMKARDKRAMAFNLFCFPVYLINKLSLKS